MTNSNKHHSKLTSQASVDAKVDHYAISQAEREGREAAAEQYPSAVIPIKYHSKKELGDIWYAAFMKAYEQRAANARQ